MVLLCSSFCFCDETFVYSEFQYSIFASCYILPEYRLKGYWLVFAGLRYEVQQVSVDVSW